MSASQRRSSLDSEFSALSQQVVGLENDYRDLKLVVVNLDKKIETAFTALSAKIDQRNVTPWASIWTALGVLLAGMTTIGWLALQPINAAIERGRADLWTEINGRNEADRRISDRLNSVKTDLDKIDGMLTMHRLQSVQKPPSQSPQ